MEWYGRHAQQQRQQQQALSEEKFACFAEEECFIVIKSTIMMDKDIA